LRATTGFLIALTIGALSGLGLTWWTLASGPRFGAMQIGPWTAWPQTGTQDADRYAKASVARSGDLPLGAGEGLAFVARHDSAGAALTGRCRYRVEPIVPPARWWTLTLYDAEGKLVANPESRYGFTSGEVVRRGDGSAEIVIGSEPAPGNWLPSPEAPFSLVLRLYDTPMSSGLATAETARLPALTMEGCP
jgi:hypothetical protein